MKSLNWTVRIRQKFDDKLTFKCVVIERWQHEFKRKLEMLNYLKKKSIVSIENCKESKKRDWMIHFQMNIDCWWKWMIDCRSRRQSNDNQIFDCDREKNTDEQLTCIQSAKLFENWYVKKQKMMSFCLRTDHRLNDVINCYA